MPPARRKRRECRGRDRRRWGLSSCMLVGPGMVMQDVGVGQGYTRLWWMYQAWGIWYRSEAGYWRRLGLDRAGRAGTLQRV